MARNVTVQVNDEGLKVAVLNGRGDLYATIQTYSGDKVRLRLDDADRSEFWAEIIIDLTALQQRLKEVESQEKVIDVTEADIIGD